MKDLKFKSYMYLRALNCWLFTHPVCSNSEASYKRSMFMIRSFQNDQILRSNATKLRRTIKTHAAKNFNQGYSITASYERTLFSFDSSFSPLPLYHRYDPWKHLVCIFHHHYRSGILLLSCDHITCYSSVLYWSCVCDFVTYMDIYYNYSCDAKLYAAFLWVWERFTSQLKTVFGAEGLWGKFKFGTLQSIAFSNVWWVFNAIILHFVFFSTFWINGTEIIL